MSESFILDVTVGHDSNAITLTSREHGGCCEETEPGSESWLNAVHRGDFLPISLSGDRGGTCIRIIFERELSETEDAEWVERFTGPLRIDDGTFVVCGSIDFLCDQEFVETDMLQIVSVPPGVYRVEIYTCFVGINGPAFDLSSQSSINSEHLGAWFRRTRPGVPIPLWLRLRCYDSPEIDPGYESTWIESEQKAIDYDEDSSTTWVDFIVRLTLQETKETVPLDESGFIPVNAHPRNLSRCALGLKARVESNDNLIG